MSIPEILAQPLGGHGIARAGEAAPACRRREQKEAGGNCPPASVLSGSPGRIRTYDTLINSQLRYHCATGECVRARKKYTEVAEKRKPLFFDASSRLRAPGETSRATCPLAIDRLGAGPGGEDEAEHGEGGEKDGEPADVARDDAEADLNSEATSMTTASTLNFPVLRGLLAARAPVTPTTRQ